MSGKRETVLREDSLFLGLVLLAWFLGPVRWVVHNNPGLTEADWSAQVLALQEYGFRFALAAGAFNIFYLSLPYLVAVCRKLLRRVRERSMAVNDGVKDSMKKR